MKKSGQSNKSKAVLGNTKKPLKGKKQTIQSKRWCFTWNNYDSIVIHYLMLFFQSNKILYIIGEEFGPECGTPHLQGYIECPTKKRWEEFHLPHVIHWERCKGDREQNIKYCSKSEIYHCSDIFKPIEIIKHLYDWQKDIENLLNINPDGRTVHWYFDKLGGIGKSSFCKYMYVKHNIPTIQGGKLADIMNIIFNMNYVPKLLLIDIPRNNGNKVSYTSIECILNGMITNTKFETGIKVFNPPHVVVFANEKPDKEKLSKDRWNIVNLSPGT